MQSLRLLINNFTFLLRRPYLYLGGCLHGGPKDPSTRKILEGGTSFCWVYGHAEVSVLVPKKRRG